MTGEPPSMHMHTQSNWALGEHPSPHCPLQPCSSPRQACFALLNAGRIDASVESSFLLHFVSPARLWNTPHYVRRPGILVRAARLVSCPTLCIPAVPFPPGTIATSLMCCSTPSNRCCVDSASRASCPPRTSRSRSWTCGPRRPDSRMGWEERDATADWSWCDWSQ